MFVILQARIALRLSLGLYLQVVLSLCYFYFIYSFILCGLSEIECRVYSPQTHSQTIIHCSSPLIFMEKIWLWTTSSLLLFLFWWTGAGPRYLLSSNTSWILNSILFFSWKNLFGWFVHSVIDALDIFIGCGNFVVFMDVPCKGLACFLVSLFALHLHLLMT